MAQGITNIRKRMPALLETASNELLAAFRHRVVRLLDHLKEHDRHVGELDAQIKAWHRSSPLSQKLEKIPGIGPLRASALVASIADARSLGSFSEDVNGHVKSCYEAKLLRDDIPLSWCFGDHGDRMQRETLRGALRVRHYAGGVAQRIHCPRTRSLLGRNAPEAHDSAVGIRLNLQPPRPHPGVEVSFPWFLSTAIMVHPPPRIILRASIGKRRRRASGDWRRFFRALKASPP